MEKSHEKRAGTILVIDDEVNICQLIKEILVEANYYVETFTNSRTAMERFDEFHFDLVITDLRMPDFSGWEVVSLVKKINPSIPVILVTGTHIKYEEKSLTEFGIDFVIPKPPRAQKLLGVISKALGSM